MCHKLVPLALALLIAGCPASGPAPVGEDDLVIFHNGTGPMCLEALTWLDSVRVQYPDLTVDERLTTDPASLSLLQQMRTEYGQSQGVSTTFGFLPIIFYRGQAFSGFDDSVETSLAGLIGSAGE